MECAPYYRPVEVSKYIVSHNLYLHRIIKKKFYVRKSKLFLVRYGIYIASTCFYIGTYTLREHGFQLMAGVIFGRGCGLEEIEGGYSCCV